MEDEWCRFCGREAPCRRDECVLEEKAERLYPQLSNRSMARKLAAGKCVDLAEVALLVEGTPAQPVVFYLPNQFYFEGMDYCHAPTESWVFSIGRERASGRVLVAFDARYYESPDFECLWLR